MTDDDKLELLFRAGDDDLEDHGFSARVLRRLRMPPPPRRWVVPLVFTLAGICISLAISPWPASGSMSVDWMSLFSSSAVSLATCGLVALVSIGAALMREQV